MTVTDFDGPIVIASEDEVPEFLEGFGDQLMGSWVFARRDDGGPVPTEPVSLAEALEAIRGGDGGEVAEVVDDQGEMVLVSEEGERWIVREATADRFEECDPVEPAHDLGLVSCDRAAGRAVSDDDGTAFIKFMDSLGEDGRAAFLYTNMVHGSQASPRHR